MLVVMITVMIGFGISIIFKLNTAYYDGSQIITDRRKMLSEYKKRFLWWDVIAILSIIYSLIAFNDSLLTKILSFPIFARTKSLIDNISILEEKMNLEGN